MEYSDTTNELINDSSMFSCGKYEILFATALPENPEECDDLDHGMVDINGASCDPNRHYKYKINWKVIGKEIDSVDFKMPTDEAKLSTIFGTLPYGLIKKNRTGVGATTLELNSSRNSIVVVPTRALAYGKAKSSRIEGTDKYSVLYVGGRIPGFTIPTVENYLSDETIQYKKFIVVVDSLPTLLNRIGAASFKDYFIMFDEIDCYQYDSSFRSDMEKGFDYYFKFPETQRCLVSATVGKFSDPRINGEPIINVTFNNPAPRRILLKETNDVVITTKKHIEYLLEQHPDEKILIAFNLLKRGIHPIIKSLSEENQAKCAVLCSEKNKAYLGDLYCDIIESVLPKQITFITCSYFVGIDIEEPFHLISSADTKSPFTLLSPDKLQQIAGRCRAPEGLLSDTVIYNTNPSSSNVDMKFLSIQIVDDVKSLIDFYSLQIKVRNLFPNLIQNYNTISLQDIVENSSKKYENSSSLKLVRLDDDELKTSYFNIDNILIQIELLKGLYASPEALQVRLLNDGHQIEKDNLIQEREHISAEVIEEVEEIHQKNEEEEREDIINQLRDCCSIEEKKIEERKLLAQRLRTNSMNKNSIFLQRFTELQKHVPFEKLVELLQLYCKELSYKYNSFRKQVLIWALDENHPIKNAITANFPIGEFFTGDQLTAKLNNIWQGILGLDELSNKQAFIKLSLFCRFRRTSTIVNRRRRNGYIILSYNPLNITENPIERIPSNTDMKRYLR